MEHTPTALDAELLKGLRTILERLNDLRTSDPDDKAITHLERGIRNKIAEIESSAEVSSRFGRN